MVLVAVLNDGGLGELTIIGALMSSFVRLMLVLYNAGSSGEVCFLVLFYFADFMLVVDLHPWWLCRDWRKRILLGLLNLCWGFHPRWRWRDLRSYCHCRGMLKEFGHFGLGVLGDLNRA